MEGGHIDHIYVKGCDSVDLEIYSPYYVAMDHDALCLSLVYDAGISSLFFSVFISTIFFYRG